MALPVAALAKKVVVEIGKKIAKDKIKDGTAGNIGKTILKVIVAFMFLVVFVVYALNAQFNSVVCRGVFENILDNCPRPLVDADKLKDLAIEMHEKRDALIDETNTGVRFRGEVSGVDEQNPKLSEAQMVLLILEQLDGEMRGMIGFKDIDYSENGSKKDTNYAKTLREAESGEKWQPNWSTNKQLAHYFMAERIQVWECFLLGSDCDTFGQDLIPKDKQNIVGGKTKEGSAAYPGIRDMLEAYYDVSLYTGRTNGKEEFQKRLDQLLEEMLFNSYPEQTAGTFSMYSNGWILPMEPGTYNFSGVGGDMDYGPRDIDVEGSSKFHLGIDFGVSSAANIPFYAMKAGTVVGIGENPISGGIILLDHHDGFYSMYQHLNRNTIIVKGGQQVQQGQMLGSVSDGGIGGMHLHWEICKGTYDSGGFDYERPSKGAQRCSDQVSPFQDASLGLVPPSTAQSQAKQREAAAYYLKNKAKAEAGEVVLMPGFVPSSGLGSISGKYEGGDDPGICVHNASDIYGGLSCGTYQFAHIPGTLLEFMNHVNKNYPEYKQYLGSFTTQGSMTLATVKPKWRAAYDSNKNGFKQVQHDYIKITHFDIQANLIKKSSGYDVTKQPIAMQEMIWSFSVHHRYDTQDAWNAVAASKWKTMTNKQIASAMYDYRYARWECCRPRFISEKADILKMLGADGDKKPVQ